MAKSGKPPLTVTDLNSIDASSPVAAIVITTDSPNIRAELSESIVEQWTEAVQQRFGKETLIVILGRGETLEHLSESRMEERGWYRTVTDSPALVAVDAAKTSRPDLFTIPEGPAEPTVATFGDPPPTDPKPADPVATFGPRPGLIPEGRWANPHNVTRDDIAEANPVEDPSNGPEGRGSPADLSTLTDEIHTNPLDELTSGEPPNLVNHGSITKAEVEAIAVENATHRASDASFENN